MKENTAEEMLPYVRLLFEIDNPSLEECYRQGYQMALDGQEEEHNPFIAHNASRESEHWRQGWWDGVYGEPPMFELLLADEMPEMFAAEQCAVSQAIAAANEDDFEGAKESPVTTVAKLAAAVAGALLSYQVIDLIA